MLNLAGRVCLAKSVISAMPTYSMQVFWLPRHMIHKIDRTMRSFIGSKGNGTRGWHMVNWNTVTLDKSHGGLGGKDMDDHNTALLRKGVWQLLGGSNKLWVQAFKHKYLQEASILNVQVRPQASLVWKGLLK